LEAEDVSGITVGDVHSQDDQAPLPAVTYVICSAEEELQNSNIPDREGALNEEG
jgi:hypothetical protein